MKTLLQSTVLILVLAGFVGTAAAQVRPQGQVNFTVGVPQGEFRDNVDNPGFGVNLFGGIGVGRSPIIIGADFGFLVYGHERRTEPFSTTIPDVTVRVNTNNNIVLGHLVLRAQPQTGAIQPYVDGLFGLKYFATQTSISGDSFSDDDGVIASSTNFDDAALSYGAGAGLNVNLYRGVSEQGRPFQITLNAGARYLLGSEAEYLKKGSIERRNGQVFFETERSETTMLLTHIGVSFKF